ADLEAGPQRFRLGGDQALEGRHAPGDEARGRLLAHHLAPAGRRARRPHGGVRPADRQRRPAAGPGWPGNPTTAWTAETPFFALFYASTGHHQQAERILAWLDAHRTRLGALPEQVDVDGRPVSVAPIAWTDAVVLLALLAQDHQL